MADLNLSVNETTITLTESRTLSLNTLLSFSVFESPVIAEAVYPVIDQSYLSINVFDALTVTESPTVVNAITPPTIRYVDFVNGNNANDGSSWVLAKKTVAGVTGLSSTDIVRIAKSTDPTLVGEATVQDNWFQVLFADLNVTKSLDTCELNWYANVPSGVVSALDSITYKQGQQSVKLTIPSMANAKLAWNRLQPQNAGQFETLNLSAYTNLNFWLYRQSADDTTVGRYKVCLCSDLDGETIVDEFVLDIGLRVSQWQAFQLTRTGGGALGSAIKSVAIYQIGGALASTLQIDNIFAGNDLGLRSVIGVNSRKHEDPRRGADKTWYPIKNIIGGRVVLNQRLGAVDGDTATGGATVSYQSVYRNRTESVSVYQRNGIVDTTIVSTTTAFIIPQQSCFYEFGWNVSTNQRDGETFYDNLYSNKLGLTTSVTSTGIKLRGLGLIGMGVTLDDNDSVYSDLWVVAGAFTISGSRCLFRDVRVVQGSDMTVSVNQSVFDNVWFIGCLNSGNTIGVRLSSVYDTYFNNFRVLGSVAEGQIRASTFINNIFNFCDFGNMSTTASKSIFEFLASLNYENIFVECTFENAQATSVGAFSRSGNEIDATFIDCIFRNNGTDFINNVGVGYGKTRFINTQLLSATRIGALSGAVHSSSLSYNEQMLEGNVDVNRVTSRNGTIETDLAEFRTASPCMSMINSGFTSNLGAIFDFPNTLPDMVGDKAFKNKGDLILKLKAPMTFGQQRTLNLYMKAESGFTGGVRLMVKGNGKVIVPPFSISPVLTTAYQLYTIELSKGHSTKHGVFELQIMLDNIDTAKKIFVDDFNWA